MSSNENTRAKPDTLPAAGQHREPRRHPRWQAPAASWQSPLKVQSTRGFFYLWVLFLVAAMGIGLAATGTTWTQVQRRAQEQELLHAGDLLRTALRNYRQNTPSGFPPYPTKLEELLLDPRRLETVRHLRRVPYDPITAKKKWGLLLQDSGIIAVYSLSTTKPLKESGFPKYQEAFTKAKSYRDWIFTPREDLEELQKIRAAAER